MYFMLNPPILLSLQEAPEIYWWGSSPPVTPQKKIKVGYFLVFDLRTIFLVYLSIGNVLLNARQCQSLLEILLLDNRFTTDLWLIYKSAKLNGILG